MSSAANSMQVGGEHYRKQRIQHWDYVLANDIPYMEAQIIKYVSRWRDKNGLEDLRKAEHFLQKLMEHHVQQQDLLIKRYDNDPVNDAAKAPPLQPKRRRDPRVKPTGFVGWTFEGGTAAVDMFSCWKCRQTLHLSCDEDLPEVCPSCGYANGYVNTPAAEPGAAYVNQG